MLYIASHVGDEGKTPAEMRANPDLARYVEGWGRAHDTGFVAVDESCQQPVGAVWMRLFAADDRGYGYVAEATPELAIAVLPAHHGHGIGTGLLSALSDATRSLNVAVLLSVRATNPAVRLYRRLGFEAIDGTETRNRTGGSSFTMKLALRRGG